MSKFKLLTGLTLFVALVALGIGQSKIQNVVAAENNLMAPSFMVDPFWPKPLPNQWIMGPTIGIDIDEIDHIFIVHRATEDLFGLGTEIGLCWQLRESWLLQANLLGCREPGWHRNVCITSLMLNTTGGDRN